MNCFKLFYFITTLLILSCNSTKNTKKVSEQVQIEAEKMIMEGFKKGTVIASEKKGDCPYIIELQSNDKQVYLDPIDLPTEFKKNEILIWFKFTPSRRIKRCEKADPVILNENIHLRN